MKLIETFASRFKFALAMRKYSASQFSEMADINKSTISQYLSGKYEPKRLRIELFAQILNVDESWLMGYDNPREREIVKENSSINFAKIPLYSSISSGYTSSVSEFIEMIAVSGLSTEELNYFAVKIIDDSMEPRIPKNSLVIIKRDSVIENDEIGAFYYNDITCVRQKKVYDKKIVLHPYNLAYDSLPIDEYINFKEAGKVVKVIIDL